MRANYLFNAAYILLLKSFSIGAAILTSFLLIKLIDEQGFEFYSLLMPLLPILGHFFTAGSGRIITKTAATIDLDSNNIFNIYYQIFFFFFFANLCYFLLALACDLDLNLPSFALASLGWGCANIVSEHLRGEESHKMAAFTQFSPQIIIAFFLGLSILLDFAITLVDIFCLFGGLYFSSVIIGCLSIKIRSKFRFLTYEGFVEGVSASYPLFLMSMLSGIVPYVDLYCVALFVDEDLSQYALIQKSAWALNLVQVIVNSMIGGKIAFFIKHKEIYNLKKLLLFSSRLSSFSVIIGAALLSLFIDHLLSFAGQSISRTSIRSAFYILMLGQFINSCFGATGMVLIMGGRQKESFLAVISALAIGSFFVISLAYYYGAIGAAIGALLTLLLQNYFCLRFVNKYYGVSTTIFG